MKQNEKTATAANFTAINFGKLNELGDYVLELSPEVKIPGKVFGGAALQATGSEFSFQLFQPGTETGFLHTHKTHEELYFFLKIFDVRFYFSINFRNLFFDRLNMLLHGLE